MHRPSLQIISIIDLIFMNTSLQRCCSSCRSLQEPLFFFSFLSSFFFFFFFSLLGKYIGVIWSPRGTGENGPLSYASSPSLFSTCVAKLWQRRWRRGEYPFGFVMWWGVGLIRNVTIYRSQIVLAEFHFTYVRAYACAWVLHHNSAITKHSETSPLGHSELQCRRCWDS